MKLSARVLAIAAGLVVLAGLPVLFYLLGDAPRRSALKEALSIVTLLSFSFLLGQVFLSRINAPLLSVFRMPAVQKVHKYIGYTAISVLLLHPVMIVLPRYFEGGIRPWDALWTMLTEFDSLGIVLGLAAWAVMLVLGLTAFRRTTLMRRFANRYRGWRYFHGVLAAVFTVLATWHAVELGRHTDAAMSTYFVAMAALGVALLVRLYWSALPSRPAAHALPEGAKS